jgi:hypothetical protein
MKYTSSEGGNCYSTVMPIFKRHRVQILVLLLCVLVSVEVTLVYSDYGDQRIAKEKFLMFAAVEDDNLEAVKASLEKCPEVLNSRSVCNHYPCESKGHPCATPLGRALICDHKEVAKFLESQGGKIPTSIDGNSPYYQRGG